MPGGFPLVVSAPSGTGKSTVCRRLLEGDRSLRYSVSCTTRRPRPGERNGRDYRFVPEDEFKRSIRSGEFAEWALVHGRYYGTPKRFLDEHLSAGRVVVLAIDIQGARSLRRKWPDAVTIFLVPPSWRSLQERLNQRQQGAGESLQRRLSHAPVEFREARHYDYLVVNGILDQAVRDIEAIILAERLRTVRRDLSALGIEALSEAASARR